MGSLAQGSRETLSLLTLSSITSLPMNLGKCEQKHFMTCLGKSLAGCNASSLLLIVFLTEAAASFNAQCLLLPESNGVKPGQVSQVSQVAGAVKLTLLVNFLTF